ncbi:MAG TPA: hypothetical protein VFH73_19725 [Polyangia bacterium]|jgi:hypothetical protein|nr:hypothetical protein [Polyangia bacterium]
MGRGKHAERARGRRTWLVLVAALSLRAGVVRAEAIVRNPSEGDGDFMARALGPSVELAKDVVRSTEIAPGKLTLIAFVNIQDAGLVGHLLVERSPGHFEHVTFQSCESEGAAPELMAVFFARTSKGRGRDLAVLCRWEQRHAVANGMLYGAEFYRTEDRGSTTVVEPVAELNKKFKTDNLVHLSEHDKWIQGPRAKFSTVAEVKRLLTRMGLKQSPQ